MTSITKYLVLWAACLAFSTGLLAQFDVSSAITIKPPKNRELFHDYIDKEQKDLLATQAIVKTVDEFQLSIETDSLLDHRLKVNYLTGMSNMLKYVKNNWRTKKFNILHLPQTIDAYKECVAEDFAGNSIENIVYRIPYDAGHALLAANIFNANKGYQLSKNLLVLKYCTSHPSSTFITL